MGGKVYTSDVQPHLRHRLQKHLKRQSVTPSVTASVTPNGGVLSQSWDHFVTFDGRAVKLKIELPCTREHRFEGLSDVSFASKCAKT